MIGCVLDCSLESPSAKHGEWDLTQAVENLKVSCTESRHVWHKRDSDILLVFVTSTFPPISSSCIWERGNG